MIAPASAQDCDAPVQQITGPTYAEVAQVFSSIRPAVGSPEVIAVLQAGDFFEVTGAPTISGCHSWLPINFHGTTGYITEGITIGGVSDYWVEAVANPGDYMTAANGVVYYSTTEACPGAPAPQLTSPAAVAQVYSSLRADIHSNTVLDVLLVGDEATVDAGPFCSFGPYNWYQITFDGQSGWATEGTGDQYWLAPAGEVVAEEATAEEATTEEGTGD